MGCLALDIKKGIVSLLRPLRAHAEEGSKEGTHVCVIMCVCACHVLSSLIRHVCALSAALRGITQARAARCEDRKSERARLLVC